MSGDSSLGIGIGLALKSYGRGLTYVKTDRALDLGNLEPFTIPDLSGNANTATLYTGIYVSTNGTTDKAIGADATALGSGNYYLTGKIKPAGTTAKTTMDGSTASNLTGLTAGVWQDFQTATASAITPSSINLGWDGTAFNATVDNWSDVKLHDASDDSVVAHYKLYDSADASLDGYPALDCVGGYHGAHVGCSSGSGEGVDADVAGIPATLDDKMYFDGVNDSVSISPIDLGTGNFILKATVILTGNGNINPIFGKGFGSRYFRVSASGAQVDIREESGTVRSLTLNQNFPFNEATDIEFIKSGNVISVKINGVTQTNTITETPTSQHIIDHIGFDVTRTNGVIWNIDINGQLSWDGTIADGNVIGTVNGNPVTVGQKRETILQTAGEDFNKLMWFDGVNDYVDCGADYTTNTFFGACVIEFTTYIANTGVTQVLCAIGSSAYRIYTNGGNWKVNGGTQVIGQAVESGIHTIAVTFNASGQATAFSYDGSVVWTGTEAAGSLVSGTTFRIGANFNGLIVNETSGLIYDFSITGSAVRNLAYTGTELITWTDTSGGSNNGTVNGSPSLYHVAESETTAGQDALGNAIENPRPNERVLNLTTRTGYATVADSASLDLTTAATWEVWPDFRSTGSERYILSKYDTGGNNRSWAIGVENPVAGSNRLNASFGDPANGTFEARLDWAITEGVACYHIIYDGALTGTARCKLYKNGVLVALSGSVANPPASLYQNNTPVLVGGVYIGGVVSSIFDEQLGDIRIYDRVLTADEITKNYNARKSAYGL